MAEYESLAHLPRWRRVLIWSCESQVFHWVVFLALLAPMLFFGLWWAAVLAALGIGFLIGYWVARSHWKEYDDVPPL